MAQSCRSSSVRSSRCLELSLGEGRYFQGHWYQEAISLLIGRSDIDVNCQSKGGQTALFSAARHDEGAVVDLLLANKAVDINCQMMRDARRYALLLRAGVIRLSNLCFLRR